MTPIRPGLRRGRPARVPPRPKPRANGWKESHPLTAASPSPLVDFILHHAEVRVNVCSLQTPRRGYELERRTVPDYNLIFVREGRPVWVLRDDEVELSPGALLIVPPGVPHHGFSRTQRVGLLSLHVEPTLAGGQDVFQLAHPPMTQHVPPGTRLERYLHGAWDEFGRAHPDHTLVFLSSWGRLVTLEMLRHDDAMGLLDHSVEDPLIVEMLRELDRRITEPTSLSDLAGWSGFSAQHLNRVFRQALGVTPLQHLARLRIDKAAGLLREGRLTVQAIAEQCGFNDPYYFSRAFKQHVGQSPADYRQVARERAPAS